MKGPALGWPFARKLSRRTVERFGWNRNWKRNNVLFYIARQRKVLRHFKQGWIGCILPKLCYNIPIIFKTRYSLFFPMISDIQGIISQLEEKLHQLRGFL